MSWNHFNAAFDGKFYETITADGEVGYFVDVPEAPYRPAGTYKFMWATTVGGMVVESYETDLDRNVKPYGVHYKCRFKTDPESISGVMASEHPEAYQWALARVINPTIGRTGQGSEHGKNHRSNW
jgi:hypothetical protein